MQIRDVVFYCSYNLLYETHQTIAKRLGTNSTKFHGEITLCMKEYYLEFSNTEISIHIDVKGRKCINIR